MRRAVIAIVALTALALALPSMSAPSAEGCAFSRTPTAYEGPRDRSIYLLAEEAAGYNMIAPSDTFFGTPTLEVGTRANRGPSPDPYIPPRILKPIGYIESALAQAASSVPWGAVGPALVSFDCGHGIMQITSGMTSPQDGSRPSKNQALVATHFLYNVGRGAAILTDKWNYAPEVRPIAGTDTNSTPRIGENWYFALWSYNGFTGPGANRSNHPMDPIYAAWPRVGFSCGPADDGFGHSYGNYPYQEIIFGCARRPPSVDGARLWQPWELSLPNLNSSTWRNPLSLSNFTSSDGYRRMDMPSPSPAHTDSTPRPSQATVNFLRADPRVAVSRNLVDGNASQVTISNSGSGIVPWRINVGQSWISVDKQGGVALSSNAYCSSTCQRTATITIRSSQQSRPGWVDVENLITGGKQRITVSLTNFDVNCDGVTNALDALLVLQHNAGLSGLGCAAAGDANGDGRIDAVDAALILQASAAL
jgi:hypothetical protein